MTKILGFSARKQGGKTTSCNFLFGLEMLSIGLIGEMKIDEQGRLCVPIILEDGSQSEGCIDPVDPRPEVKNWYAQTIWPFIKIYQLADPLKMICQDILGLSYEQCNGTNEQKETETHLKWEDMPNVITPGEVSSFVDAIRMPMNEVKENLCYPMALDPAGPDKSGRWLSVFDDNGFITHKPGAMTARQVMQYVGTDIFRRMHFDVWVDATIRRIQREQPQLAIISDVRFPNEVKGIQKAGGKVIRFTRAPFANQDEHASETALDDYPLENFDAVIENHEMKISEQNKVVHQTLMEWGFLSSHVEATTL